MVSFLRAKDFRDNFDSIVEINIHTYITHACSLRARQRQQSVIRFYLDIQPLLHHHQCYQKDGRDCHLSLSRDIRTVYVAL